MRGVASNIRVSLTTDDADALLNSATLLQAVVPEMQTQLQVKYGNMNINTTIVGTTPNFVAVQELHSWPPGGSSPPATTPARERYAVLGSSARPAQRQPGGDGRPDHPDRGASLRDHRRAAAEGRPGFLPEPRRADPDPAADRPLPGHRHQPAAVDHGPGARTASRWSRGWSTSSGSCAGPHKIRPGGDNDFQIRNQQDILATQQQTTQTFTTLLASIAAVSLLVGGIGIMNIMLVSVTERTREIGIRKALGATKVNILMQFLIEALVLCMAGGLLGIGLGAGITSLLAHAAGWNALISMKAVALSFGFSAAIGLFFGIWPARRAASMDPIVALRYE